MRYIVRVSDDLHLDAFRAKIREDPEAEQATMTIAEQLRREGQVEERASILTKLLKLKFKDLSSKHYSVIAKATAEELEQYVERVLEARNIDEVFDK